MTETSAHHPLAVLFPGQGSQELGMGREAAEADAESMELWVRAEKLCRAELRGIYWEEGDAGQMAATVNLQPALTVVGMTLWKASRTTRSVPLAPACVAGHSLGEYAALFAAGVLPADGVLDLVIARGRLMAEMGGEGDTGTMAAVVKLDRTAVDEIVAEAASITGGLLVVANANSPAQFVISGDRAAVDAAAGLAKQRKGRAIPLPVSGAFHSPLMSEPARKLANLMRDLPWRDAALPVVLNVTGEPARKGGEIASRMAEQMTSGVQWTRTMHSMYAMGVRRFVELGPKGVLAKLVSANLDGRPEPVETFSCPTPASLAAL